MSEEQHSSVLYGRKKISHEESIISKLNKELPHSISTEQYVLGGLLSSSFIWENVADLLTVEDFFDVRHQVIFKTMLNLDRQNRGIDIITISDELESYGDLETIGGTVYLIDLTNDKEFTLGSTVEHVYIIRKKSVFRQLIQEANSIIESVFNPRGRKYEDILDSAERGIFKIHQTACRSKSGPQELGDVLFKTLSKIDEMSKMQNDSCTGVASGFVSLDKKTAGFQPGDFIVIAGRPSMGKTLLAVNMGHHIAERYNEGVVLLFSMEMPNEQIGNRLLSAIGNIDMTKIKTGNFKTPDEYKQLNDAVKKLSKLKFLIDDTPALTPTEMRARARRVARKYGKGGGKGINAIIIDYLQLMKVAGHSDNRTNEISEISRSLKALAKELDVPVIALSQLNRDSEKRHDKRPILADLRDSGAIEQDADLVLLIHREISNNKNSKNSNSANYSAPDSEDNPDKNKTTIIIAKHRNGPTGEFSLGFCGKYCRFNNMD